MLFNDAIPTVEILWFRSQHKWRRRSKARGRRMASNLIVSLQLEWLRGHRNATAAESVRICVKHSHRDRSHKALTLRCKTYASERYNMAIRIDLVYNAVPNSGGCITFLHTDRDSLICLALKSPPVVSYIDCFCNKCNSTLSDNQPVPFGTNLLLQTWRKLPAQKHHKTRNT